MTAGLDEATDTAPDDAWCDDAPVAGWWQRAGAFAIDVLCPLAAVTTGLLAIGSLLRWPVLWALFIVAIATLLIVAINRWALTAIAGWSLGRAVTGIAVVDRHGGPVGAGRLVLRDVAHLVDTLPFCLGWLWPLLDARGRTFADMIARTEVHRLSGDRPDRRPVAARVIGAAAVLSVLVAVLGYGVVYRHQQAVATARATIADEGPTLVADMLSYTVKTAADDFAHARDLVTDGYRPELVRQQEAVQKNGLVDNDYWVTNSAVLSSSEDRATMLLLLQGQRGAAPTQRFVTASVRAEYEKHGDRWQVSNVAVLTAPKPPPAPAPAPAPAEQAPSSGKPAPPSSAKPAPPRPSAGGR